MRKPKTPVTRLTDTDLDFVVGLAAPDAGDPERLKQLALEDDEFRKALVGDDAVFEHVTTHEERSAGT
jgi:hypothetical protein